ncbi:MAG: hypothetical protein WC824_14705 [Bacteroidota bacterium]|jgi:hypothetical protein
MDANEVGKQETYSSQDDLYWNWIEPMGRAMKTKTPLGVIWTRFQGRNVLALGLDGEIRPLTLPHFFLLDPRFQCGDPKLESEFMTELEAANTKRESDNAFLEQVCKVIDQFNIMVTR